LSDEISSIEAIGIDYFYNVDFPNDGLNTWNVKNKTTSNKFLNSIFTAVACLKILFIALNKKDLALVHCHDTPALLIGYFIKKIKNCKLVYDAHELESNKGGQSRLFSVITRFIEHICFSTIDGFITVSPSILKWYEEKYNVKQSRLIFNAPDKLEVIKVEDIRKTYNIPESNLIFTHIGLLNEGRGIEELLDSFSKVKDKYIIFFGFGELEDLIRSYAEKNKNILYFGNVKNYLLHSYLSMCDYGLCTIEATSLSDQYSLPNKFFEYVNSGLNVIVSDLKDLRNYVEKYNLGYVKKENEELYNLLESITEKKKLEEIPDDLTWKEQAKKLLSLYKNIL